jgi:DHA2 family multidrug resistance protein
MLIVFRILQGAGGGGLQPTEQAILADTFSAKQRGMAFAIYGMAIVVAPAVGPTLGGWITDNYSWHWIFLINVPIGILSLALTHRVVQDPVYLKKLLHSSLRVDYIGISLIVVGVGFLQYVLDKGQENDWFASKIILISSIVAIVALVALVFRELTHKNPIMDLRLLAKQNFVAMGASTSEASHRALAQLSAQIDLQANVLSFVNAFWMLGLIVMLLIPLPFIMRRPSPEEAKASAAAH